MNTRTFYRFAVLSLLVLISISLAARQTTEAVSAAVAPPAANIFTFLPASDGVMVIDVHRLLSETMPRVFAGDAAKSSSIESDLDDFKKKTGVDPHQIDRAVLATRYRYPSPGVTKLETVAIAQGKFDVKAIAEAGRASAQAGYREIKYHGLTMMIFGVHDNMRVLGLWKVSVKDLSVCALNANTLAIGSPSNVQAVIDRNRTRTRANAALVTLATRDPQALIGFGANTPTTLMANLNLGSDSMAKDVNSIRQVYGSISTANTDVSLLLVARTDTAEAAKNLGDTITGLKQLGGFMIMRLTGSKRALAESALSNLKIATRATELEIRTQFAAADLASVLK